MFVGTYERSLDDKGRLALPASFRSMLGETAYVASLSGGLGLFSNDEFSNAVERMSEQVRNGELRQADVRLFGSSARIVNVDRQGRITLPSELREEANISSEATVIGAFKRVEIYQPDVWAQIKDQGEDIDLGGGAWL